MLDDKLKNNQVPLRSSPEFRDLLMKWNQKTSIPYYVYTEMIAKKLAQIDQFSFFELKPNGKRKNGKPVYNHI